MDSIPTWGIKPEILNNIIIGGNDSSSSYGIFINNQIDPEGDWCVIFNNAFDKSRCQIYVRTDSDTYSSINAFQTAGDISPDPINNDAYNITGIDTDIRFLDPSNYNYRIDPASPDTSFIIDKGYNDIDGNPSYQAADIYSPPEAALYDIDGEARPTDYSNIDLGADEFN